MKRILITLTLATVATAIAIFLKTSGGISNQSQTRVPDVVTSFYPLYYFSSEIAGDTLSVTNITPAGAEPHDYEPTTADVSALQTSKLVIINGLGLEPWSQKFTNLPFLILGDAVKTRQLQENGASAVDPHIWLDPVLAQEMVKAITQAFITVDHTQKTLFEQNEAGLISQLQALDQEFQTGLASCKLHTIITSHAAFGYLAARYGFEQITISGISPDEEPTPQKIAEVLQIAKEKRIKTIFFETLVSPRLAQTVAREVGATTAVFNPLEGLTEEEVSDGQNYFSVQRQNLANLKTALMCVE